MRIALASVVAVCLVGCYNSVNKFTGDTHVDPGTDPAEEPIIPPPECPGGSETWAIDPSSFPAVDILVVVDNSMSMAEEQSSLVAGFRLLLQSLLDPPGSDLPVGDLHIGVVSTDMGTGGYSVETCRDPIDGDNGELLHAPNPSISGCDSAYANHLAYGCTPFMCPDVEAIGWITTAFGCIATLGIEGCGFEQHMKAAHRALIENRTHPSNAGFLRDSSILAILFITDEEDCSVAPGNERIFDTFDSSLGHLNLRCFNHPYMVQDVNTYIADFDSLRTDPAKLVLGFIVGVPQDPVCEGLGSDIPNCLTHPDMQEAVDPLQPTRLVPSCVRTGMGEAYPPRRFVTMAQQFGERALVSSVCRGDFSPAMDSLAGRIHEIAAHGTLPRDLDTSGLPADPCVCVTDCRIVEALSDLRTCDSVGKPCYMPDGVHCAPPEVDPDGLQHTLCEIPQAGTRMAPCVPSAPPICDSTGVTHAIDGAGWYYMGRSWLDPIGTMNVEPRIFFTEGMEPEEGSDAYLTCCI